MTPEQQRAIALAAARARAAAAAPAAPAVDREAIRKNIENDPISTGARNFAADMPALSQFNAGVGRALTNLGRAGAQLVNMGPNAEEVREQRRLDAPLMQTGAGMAGDVAGNIAAFAPLAVVPGANTVAGAGALGAVMGGFQPTEGNPVERLVNMGVGGATGAGTQAVMTKVPQYLGERAAARLSAPAEKTLRQETYEQGVKAGFVVPPSTVNPSFLNTKLESIGGKAAVGQEAAIRNQALTDALMKQDAGLAPNEAISKPALERARNALSKPYRDIAEISPSASRFLEDWKTANANAKKWQALYDRLPHPNVANKVDNFRASSELALDNIEREAAAIGRADLVPALKQARVDLAKNFSVERAMNVGSGEIDASVLGRMLDNNVPLTGNAKLVAQMQQAFPQFMREGGRVPTPDVSALNPIASVGFGMGGAALAGNPAGALAGGLPLLRGPARSLVLSPGWQQANMLAQPQGPTALTKELAALNDPEVQRRIALLSRALVPGVLSAAEAQ